MSDDDEELSIAEMMIEGILCSGCGFLINEDPLGFPDHCDECEE